MGDSTYVGSMTYTEWGAVDLVELGTAGSPVLQVDYSYYAWTGGGGEGQARLYRITAGTPGYPTSLQDLRYFYDLAGNIETIQDWKAGSPQAQSLTYDDLDRLLSGSASGGRGGTYSESYEYTGTDGKIGNLTSKGGVSYTYTDAAHKHAVTKLNGVQKYWYDANGNQTTRITAGGTYNLSYDAENHLTTVSGAATATFVYGPGGERVKGTVNGGTTTLYIGSHYEKQGSTIRKYYYAGSQRVAMRESGTLYWLLTDHLGSQAITANGTSGAKVGEVRYKAWGEDRYTSGTTPTTWRFTGQRADSYINMYLMGARYYDPALGRFISPDTIIPQVGNPQALNRYSYAYNDPVRYTDPTGHKPLDEDMAGFLHWKPPDRSPCYSSGWCAPIKDSSKVHQTFHYGEEYSEEYGDLAGVAHPGEDIFSDQQPLEEDIGIYAIGAGVVVKNEYGKGYGNHTMIRHNLPGGEKAYSLYAHMADLPDLEAGTVVGGGQRIGTMGHTGNSDDGDHLHFEVRKVTAKSWKGDGTDNDPKVTRENVDTWWYSPYGFLQDRGVVIDW